MSDLPNDGVRDTGPLQSKKFLVILLASLGWKVLIGGGLLLLRDQVDADSAWLWWWMITATIVAGFVEVGGLLGIAFVDKYVRVAKIMANGAQKLARKAEDVVAKIKDDEDAG